MQRRGLSLIELVTVLTIFLALSYFALPAFDIVQVKSREKLLRLRLFDMRRAIDSYVKARNSADNPYPPSLASLAEAIPTNPINLLRNGGDSGPFVGFGNLGNPFAKTDDVFLWDVRDSNGNWEKNQTDVNLNYTVGVYDVRYPEDGVNGWEKAIDGTFYKEW